MSSKIIHKKLSYKVNGVLFDVIKQLGSSYHEKYYQRAIEARLKQLEIPYKREKKVDIKIGNNKIGHHFIDFVVDGKIVLEIKRGFKPRLADIKQVLMYLKSSNLKLGILAYFGSSGVIIKRVINSSYNGG